MSKTIPPVSIIIPTLNEEKYLPILLNSLRNINASLDIIVVDGNSTDDTINVAKKFEVYFSGLSSLRVICSPERGIGFQRNLGVQIAKHPVIMFCDADVIAPSENDFFFFVSEFIKKKFVVAGPMLVPIEKGKRVAFSHMVLLWIQGFLLLLGKPYFGGGALLSKKEIFNKIGGFDTSVLLGEDLDYCLRASKHGECHRIKIKWKVSARRFVKYGYRWIFRPYHFTMLLVKGRVKNAEDIFYPFGEYDK